MYMYICHIYSKMVCQKRCQNRVSGWGSLEVGVDPWTKWDAPPSYNHWV